ncbi:hypothetical protein [Bradyrhizobium sp. STM 3557]|uniref:hypothetical protein n=1 Tax=Bradyrhizobium sp. STM 3557 TaxID=578920 RepID=UPI003890F237
MTELLSFAHVPPGYRYTLVLMSVTKRALQGEMPETMRLCFLQHLDKMLDTSITPEIVSIVEPMCDEGFKIVKEAMKLGASKSLDIYAQRDTFAAFCNLNPSLVRAIEKMFPCRSAHSGPPHS